MLNGPSLFFRLAALAAVAEFVVVFVSTPIGLVLHAIVLIACAVGYLRSQEDGSHRVLIVLALVPVSRLLGLTMPLEHLPRWSWYVMAGLPLLAGAGLMTIRLGLRPRQLGLRRPASARLDVAVIAVGLLLGLIAGWLDAGPSFNATDGALGQIAVAASLFLFVAVPEELIFRGLLQPLAHEAHGLAGVVMVTVLYATTFLTSFSAAVVLVMSIAGAAFAGSIARGGSLWGTVAGHALLVIGAALVWPALLD